MEYLTLTLGFVILLGSAELLVRGSVTIARLFGISPMVIGMTIVAIGTSAPELVVSVEAALSDAPVSPSAMWSAAISPTSCSLSGRPA